MIEVVFNDSAKGSLLMAKNYNKESIIADFLSDMEEQLSQEEVERMFEGEAIGGNPDDRVVCIGFQLDRGDINGALDGDARRKQFKMLDGIHIGVEDEVENYAENYFKLQREEFEYLIDAAQKGELIRIWRGNSPHSACGFAFLCHALRNINCEMSVISLPQSWYSEGEYLEEDDEQLHYCFDWGEVQPGQWYKFLFMERKVSSREKQVHSDLWGKLKNENAPLRALVSGQLISVPEDFYDHLIMKHIPEGEFYMAQLIGTLLGNYPLGVHDSWYGLRINKMIAEKKLTLIGVLEDEDSVSPYSKRLKK